MKPRVLAIVPDADAPPDIVQGCLAAQGIAISSVNPHVDDYSIHDDADGLVIMGGAESVLDPRHTDMFGAMCDTVRLFHATGRPVLGVCLGGQVVARAFGGAIARVGELQFGYLNVRLRREAYGDALLAGQPSDTKVFCWHEDRFALPDGAVWLAESARVPEYGFRLGAATYGFQCHFEFSPPTLDKLIARGAHLVPKNLGAAGEELLRRFPADRTAFETAANRFGTMIGNAWAKLVLDAAQPRVAAPPSRAGLRLPVRR